MTYALTGTAEDMMTIVSQAEEKRLARAGIVFPRKRAAWRLLLEPPLNLVGKLVALLIRIIPRRAAIAIHTKIFRSLSAPRHYPYRQGSPAIKEGIELARRIRMETGRPAALLALISHPPMQGEMTHFNFELVHHATLALRDLREAPCRPRLVTAIDSFALDMFPLAVEALYAGAMETYHLGLDRMAMRRSTLSGLLLRDTAWPRMPYRLLRLLAGGGEVGLVLSGGVPATTRILYAAKEWLIEQAADSALRSQPAAVLKSLEAHASFSGFNRDWSCRSAWRKMEAWLALTLSGLVGHRANPSSAPAYTGKLTPAAHAAAGACLAALGFGELEIQRRIQTLADELERETPYRARFFRALAQRVLAKGRPLVLLPIVHRIEGSYGIEIKSPWAWTSIKAGRLETSRLQGEISRWRGSVRDFSRIFVRENFA